MESTEVEVNVRGYAVLPWMFFEKNKKQKQIDACHEIARTFVDFKLDTEYAICSKFTLVYLSNLQGQTEIEGHFSNDLNLPFSALKMEVTFVADPHKADIQSSDPAAVVSNELRHALVLHGLRDRVLNSFRDIAIAANIAKPGSIRFYKLMSFTEGISPDTSQGMLHGFDEALDRATELSWPSLSEMEISKIWHWLEALKTSQKPGSRKLRRAVSALTHLCDERAGDENSLALVWALAGLESIYGEGNVGSKGQLLKKSEALLGARRDNKKKFSWMYDYRSRLLHGDLDINPAYDSRWFASAEKFNEEVYECQQLATAMLIGTLQQLCLKNAFEVDFEYLPKFSG